MHDALVFALPLPGFFCLNPMEQAHEEIRGILGCGAVEWQAIPIFFEGAECLAEHDRRYSTTTGRSCLHAFEHITQIRLD
jgi:hypothetical protein